MKLLILTQKVDINDDILGFFHGWIAEFAKHCEKIIVICLQKGEYELPGNVKVLSLGKEEKIQNSKFKIFKKLLYCWKFYKYIWQERKNYDAVFVHMNPEYAVLGGILWKLWNKKIFLWYVHRAVNLKLRIAEKLADIIFTASKESFCLHSKKLKIIGHGIDTSRFKIPDLKFQINKRFKIVYVGRISRIKNQELLIRAVDILVNSRNIKGLGVDFAGSPTNYEGRKYLDKLKNLVKGKKLENFINFVGAVPNKKIAEIYNKADLSINLCPTGGVDKVVLESMACGVPVIVYNKAFVSMFSEYKDELMLNIDNEKELAKKIENIINMALKGREAMGKKLHQLVVKEYSLEKLINKIISLV